MSTYSVLDLSYAASTVALAVDDTYSRYNGDTQPNDPNAGLLTHKANIEADKDHYARVTGDKQLSDPIKDLLKIVFGKSKILGTIDTGEGDTIGVISFRGAESVQDWFNCVVLFGSVPFLGVEPEPLVHAGFLLVYQMVRDSLLEGLKYLTTCKRVIVTGHSLGAAVATLCLLDLKVNKQLPSSCNLDGVTFASPGVFYGKEGAELFNDFKNLRVHNPKDPITKVPPIGSWHVQGGLAIQPNPNASGLLGQHSMDATYERGLAIALGQAASVPGQPDLQLEPVKYIVPIPATEVEKVIVHPAQVGA